MYSNDAKYYDCINAKFQYKDIDLYVKLVKKLKPTSICELACGTGRIISKLKRYAQKCIGIDISEDMLKIARSKYADIDFIYGDMCVPSKYGSYDMIICGYNSLQHILKHEDLLSFFKLVDMNLSHHGYLIIDVFNPNNKYLFPKGNEKELVSFYFDDSLIEVVERTKYNPKTKNNHINYRYNKDGKFSFSESYIQHQYSAKELDATVEMAGFKIIVKYGNYAAGFFSDTSEKQIIIAKKQLM